jgi:hypothetical protein
VPAWTEAALTRMRQNCLSESYMVYPFHIMFVSRTLKAKLHEKMIKYPERNLYEKMIKYPERNLHDKMMESLKARHGAFHRGPSK